jgi:hypothetical protein
MTAIAYLYSLQTGKFTGRRLEGPPDVLDRLVEVGQALHFGEIDLRRNRIDLETGEPIPCKPDKPADTEDTIYAWDAAADDWKASPTDARLDREARAKRTELLAASDWVALRSADNGQPIPKEWRAYRAALRDITDQAGYPRQIEWPKAPD